MRHIAKKEASQKYKHKMADKKRLVEQVLPTAVAFLNNQIRPDGKLDPEMKKLVSEKGVDIIPSAHALMQKEITLLLGLESQIGEKLKSVHHNTQLKNKFKKFDEMGEEQLTATIAYHEDALEFCKKRKTIAEKSHHVQALDMVKRICTSNISGTGIEQLPKSLQGMQFSAGGGGGGCPVESLADLNVDGEEL